MYTGDFSGQFSFFSYEDSVSMYHFHARLFTKPLRWKWVWGHGSGDIAIEIPVRASHPFQCQVQQSWLISGRNSGIKEVEHSPLPHSSRTNLVWSCPQTLCAYNKYIQENSTEFHHKFSHNRTADDILSYMWVWLNYLLPITQKVSSTEPPEPPLGYEYAIAIEIAMQYKHYNII